jgi:hypothetical protein
MCFDEVGEGGGVTITIKVIHGLGNANDALSLKLHLSSQPRSNKLASYPDIVNTSVVLTKAALLLLIMYKSATP